jgi:hypothetical protein
MWHFLVVVVIGGGDRYCTVPHHGRPKTVEIVGQVPPALPGVSNMGAFVI